MPIAPTRIETIANLVYRDFTNTHKELGRLMLSEYSGYEEEVSRLHMPIYANLKCALENLNAILQLKPEQRAAHPYSQINHDRTKQAIELDGIASLSPKHTDDYHSLMAIREISKALQRVNQIGAALDGRFILKGEFSQQVQSFLEGSKDSLIELVQELYTGLSVFFRESVLEFMLLLDSQKLEQLSQVASPIDRYCLPQQVNSSRSIRNAFSVLSREVTKQRPIGDQTRTIEEILSSHLPEFTGPLLYQDYGNPQDWQDNFGNY